MTSLFILQERKKFTLVDLITKNGIPWIPMLFFIRNRKLNFFPKWQKLIGYDFMKASRKLHFKIARASSCTRELTNPTHIIPKITLINRFLEIHTYLAKLKEMTKQVSFMNKCNDREHHDRTQNLRTHSSARVPL